MTEPQIEVREYRDPWQRDRETARMQAEGWQIHREEVIKVRRPMRHVLLFGWLLYWFLPLVPRYRVIYFR